MHQEFDTLCHGRGRPVFEARRRLAAVAFAAAALFIMTSPASAADPLPAKAVVDLVKGKAIAGAICAACHMPDGNSMIPQNPTLAGQHAAYLEKQLHNFKVKPGAKAPERNNAIMAGFAATLSNDDIRNVSAFYATQQPKSAGAKRKELVEAGERIYRSGIVAKGVPACAGCHSPNAAGIPAQYPRLGGQHAEYTEAQMNSFRLGERKNSAQMMVIAGKMTQAEIAAVSEYIASVR
jgi:cytochrome c553